MAFCRHCGKKLEDGEVCDCQNAVMNDVLTQEYEPTDEPSISEGYVIPAREIVHTTKHLLRDMLHTFANIIRAPYDNGIAFVRQAEPNPAAIFLVCQALLSGLFGVLCVSKINSFIKLGGALTAAYKFSGTVAFFLTLLFSLLLSAVMMLLYGSMIKLCKGQASWKGVMTLVSTRSVAAIPIIAAGLLVFLLNPWVGIVIYYLSFFASVTFLSAATCGIGGISRNKAVYITLTVSILFLIIFLIFSSKVITVYVPSSIKSLLSVEGLTNKILGSML